MKALLWFLAAVSLCACARTNVPASEPAAASASPAAASSVQRALAAEGFQINGSLDAPRGYRGYLAEFHGQEVPVYALPDGQHLVIGTLFDLDGRNLTADAVEKLAGSFGEQQWQALAAANWVGEGNPRATRVVYAFVDTRCPYCQQFWQKSQPWLKQNNVQVRNILVAVIAPESLPEAAAIFASRDPAKAWNQNEKDFGKSVSPAKATSAAALAKVNANTTLFRQLRFSGTPTIVWKDAEGHIHVFQGLPGDPRALASVFTG